MDLALSEEQVALQDSVRALLADSHTTAQVRACENDPATARAIYAQLDALGLGGLLIPVDQGGVGLGAAEMVVVQMELGRALVPALYTCSTVGAASALTIAANPAAEGALAAIAEGSAAVAYAPAVPDSPQPVVTVEANGAVLNGTACFVPEAALADWLLVAVTDAAGQPALCLIARDAAGLELAPLGNLAEQDMAEVSFNQTPVAQLVATGDQAAQARARADSAMKLAIAAQAIGGAEQIFAMTRDYSCTRKQFGQPIGGFQAIAHMLAEGAVNIAGASVLVHRAAAALDEGEPQAASWGDMAKLKACQMFRDVSAMAIQVHGGIGFTLEADPQLFFRRAKHLQLMHGEPLELMEAIGAAVFDGNHRVLENV
ncbi:acyl-CoA dehydrogenase family protein [Novosphingobium sp. ES2-1]|uniref:acyl-CoA dehydrogenase family protein n=1 Tax=Novosphingobium sp. ES2-1 TaxID=2780074 RepID=UPI0018803986|nr:acyl-CoA dehydrogenase family protein [Novosphingobium sp. ES2-1]QOV96417.1 acyl-CoA/acyl-ACP dehydrogenase [Novosphingobium sp. ES2-1]